MTTVLESRLQANDTTVSTAEVMHANPELGAAPSSVSSGEVWVVNSPSVHLAGGFTWQQDYARRVSDLIRLHDGWDGHHAEALRTAALKAMTRALLDLSAFIQSAPAVSIRDDGGILCEWKNEVCSLDLDSDAQGEISIYFVDHFFPSEWEGPLAGAMNVEKWLWQASAR